MNDLISRQAAIDTVKSYFKFSPLEGRQCAKAVERVPVADVVEVGKWCDMREYILEMQADENGHNEFFRIIKLDDER